VVPNVRLFLEGKITLKNAAIVVVEDPLFDPTEAGIIDFKAFVSVSTAPRIVSVYLV
jgi:hypothetical protein